jgi:hypothetical protein
MLVGIVTNQRLDPIRPENGEHSETTAEAGEWSDQSNSGEGRFVAGVIGARLCVPSARESCSLQVVGSDMRSLVIDGWTFMSSSVELIGQRLNGSFVGLQHRFDCFDPPPYAICSLNDFVLVNKHFFSLSAARTSVPSSRTTT